MNLLEFKDDLIVLSDYSLSTAEMYEKFTEQDHVNASLILMKVLTPLCFDNFNSQEMSLKESIERIEAVGRGIRAAIKEGTGIDLPNAVEGWDTIIE